MPHRIVSSQQQGLTWGQLGWSLQYIYHPSLLLRLRTIYWKENYSSGYTIHYTLYYTQYNTIQYNTMYWKENYSMGFTIHYTLYTIYTYTGQDNWHNLLPRRSLLPWAGNFIAHQIILKWFKQQANDHTCQLLPNVCKFLIKRNSLVSSGQYWYFPIFRLHRPAPPSCWCIQ